MWVPDLWTAVGNDMWMLPNSDSTFFWCFRECEPTLNQNRWIIILAKDIARDMAGQATELGHQVTDTQAWCQLHHLGELELSQKTAGQLSPG